MSREISLTIDVLAAPQAVWAVITEFPRYAEWNPFIKEIRGQPERGACLQATVQAPGGRIMRFRAKVTEVEPEKRLRWLGRCSVLPGLLSGDHVFVLEDLGEGQTRLTQCKTFRGLLLPLLWRSVKRDTRRGLMLMNAVLKRRLEGDEQSLSGS